MTRTCFECFVDRVSEPLVRCVCVLACRICDMVGGETSTPTPATAEAVEDKPVASQPQPATVLMNAAVAEKEGTVVEHATL